MNTRILEGYEISDEAVYAFGDLTAVVTFEKGAMKDVIVGSTYGDFSDAALMDVLTNGKPIGDVQQWLAYIQPDLDLSIGAGGRQAIDAVMPEAVQTFSGTDGSGKAWLIGFDGEAFAFAPRDSSAAAHYVSLDALNIVGDMAITSRRIDVDSFVVSGPSTEMLKWLRTKLAETAR